MKTKQRVPLRIHKNLADKLAELAEKEGVSKSDLLEQALSKEKLAELEPRVRRDYSLDIGKVERIKKKTGSDCFADHVNYAIRKLLISKKML